MTHTRTLGVVLLLPTLAATTLSQGDSRVLASSSADPLGRMKALRGIRSEDWKERERAYQRMLDERTMVVRELVQLASEDVDPKVPTLAGTGRPEYPVHGPKHLAMLLLGELRAAEGVSVLLKNLHYNAPRSFFGGAEPPEFYHPAADSLIRIGKPAIEPTIEKLATTEEELERELCCRIIVCVQGEELAPILLQLAIDKEHHPQRKANLEAAKKYLPEKKLGPPGVRFE